MTRILVLLIHLTSVSTSSYAESNGGIFILIKYCAIRYYKYNVIVFTFPGS